MSVNKKLIFKKFKFINNIFFFRVALGKMFETKTQLPELENAPKGFNSVHALPGNFFKKNEF